MIKDGDWYQNRKPRPRVGAFFFVSTELKTFCTRRFIFRTGLLTFLFFYAHDLRNRCHKPLTKNKPQNT